MAIYSANKQAKGIYGKTAGLFTLEPTDPTGAIIRADVIKPKVAIQSITINTSRAMTELPDGNSQFPFDTYVESETGTIDVLFTSEDIDVTAYMNGSKVVPLGEGETMRKIDAGFIIPEDLTLEMPDELSDSDDAMLYVVGTDGTVYERGVGTAATGHFTVSGNVLTFYSDAKGKAVEITYDYVPVSGVKWEKLQNATSKNAVFTAQNVMVNQGQTARFATNIVIDQISPSGDLSTVWQKDPSGGFTNQFAIKAPRIGKKSITVKYADDDQTPAIAPLP